MRACCSVLGGKFKIDWNECFTKKNVKKVSQQQTKVAPRKYQISYFHRSLSQKNSVFCFLSSTAVQEKPVNPPTPNPQTCAIPSPQSKKPRPRPRPKLRPPSAPPSNRPRHPLLSTRLTNPHSNKAPQPTNAKKIRTPHPRRKSRSNIDPQASVILRKQYGGRFEKMDASPS